MLVTAAAKRWKVAENDIIVSKGIVSAAHRRTGFGSLARDAATLTPPAGPKLKAASDFRLIGQPLAKPDTRAKVIGETRFTMDVVLPGMIHAAILHPPRFGARVGAVDDAATRAIPGVLKVATVPSGVVVYARDFHTALKGRAALAVTWDDTKAETRSSDALFAATEALAANPVEKPIIAKGDVTAALAVGTRTIEATYLFPYLAHAPMEPLDAVVQHQGGRVDVWMGSQFQSRETIAVAEVLGVPPERATLHQCFAGGSFGRRATSGLDFAREVGAVCKAWGGPEPIKFVWTRENDLAGGFYRPMMVHRIRGAVDADGAISAWDHVIAGQSFTFGGPYGDAARKRGYDTGMVEGALEPGYDLPAHRLSVRVIETGVPTNWWRSVGHSHTGYAVEAFVDELLTLGEKDAVAGRLALMPDPRARAVLTEAAKLAGWPNASAPDRALGVAVVNSFRSYVAQIVEVSRGRGGLPRVHRVWCAVDCGIPVNPDVIRAQIEGGIGYALGHILHAELTLGESGAVAQRNFDTYPSLRIGEMPEVIVTVLPSTADPTGIGEPGVPPLGPALANAWRKLTGQSVRRLPFARSVTA
jgi:isoquinoline 1-oxidoreductase beta subunit